MAQKTLLQQPNASKDGKHIRIRAGDLLRNPAVLDLPARTRVMLFRPHEDEHESVPEEGQHRHARRGPDQVYGPETVMKSTGNCFTLIQAGVEVTRRITQGQCGVRYHSRKASACVCPQCHGRRRWTLAQNRDIQGRRWTDLAFLELVNSTLAPLYANSIFDWLAERIQDPLTHIWPERR